MIGEHDDAKRAVGRAWNAVFEFVFAVVPYDWVAEWRRMAPYE